MTNEPEKRTDVNVTPSEDAAKPKKKKPIIVVRPQNSKTGFVKAGQRPGSENKKKPAQPARRPGSGAAAPAAGAPRPRRKDAPAGTGAPVRRNPAAAQPAAAKVTAEARTDVNVKTAPVQEEILKKEAAPMPAQNVPETAAGTSVVAAAPANEGPAKAQAAAPADISRAENAQAAGSAPAAQPAQPAAPEQKAEESIPETLAAVRKEIPKPATPVNDQIEERIRAAAAEAAAKAERKAAAAAAKNPAARTRTDRPRTGTGVQRGSGAPAERRERSDRNDRSDRGDRSERPERQERRDARRDSFAGGDRPARGGSPAGARGGAAVRPGAEPKAFEKDSRKNDRNKKNNKNDLGDKFDRKERTSQQAKGGKPKNGAKAVKPLTKPPVKEEEKIKSITLPDTITIKDLADKLKIAPAAIVKKLFMQGKMVTVNEEVDFDTAEEIAIEYDVICEKEEKIDVIAELLKDEEDPEETLVERPPVVCVMGHVDHGKTSLLDAIRNTHVIDREAGGITQHIGASVVTISGKKITFLDTPGHEAFTSMRMRGANSTDIAILVVAADDGVMPQTVEAINHAKAAGIEIIVAINKIDKPGANIDRVKQELTEYQLIPEDWGGSTVFAEVSAKTHEGIDNLLEMVLLTAEVMELKANPNRRARGLVIEARLDKGRGPVATVLIQKGTLHVGDPVCAGKCYGRIRAMLDSKGRNVKEAGPSMPVEIQGFSDVPGAGEIVVSPETEKEARNFAETFISEGKERLIEETKHKMSLDDLFSQIQAGNLKELNLIVKADVQGSVEAVRQSLEKLSNEEVLVKTIHSGAGNINESDVILASASNAIIIGFNVKPDPQAKATAESEGVDMRLYSVIYNAIEDVERAMKGMLDPIYEEKILGHAQIRQTFRASGVGTIAGSYVLDGVFTRGCSARVTREGKQIFDGPIASLRRFKDDVKEVKAGYECGIVFEKFNEVAVDDEIEAYTMVEVPR